MTYPLGGPSGVTLEGIPQGREIYLGNFGDQTIEGCLDVYCFKC